MRSVWTGAISLSLGLIVTSARAADPPVPRLAEAVSLGRPSAVSLGRPESQSANSIVQPVSFETNPNPVYRGQVPELGAPSPMPSPAPPPGSGFPATPNEQFNCGVVTQTPDSKGGFWAGCKDIFGKCGSWIGGGFGASAATPGYSRFQSDHGFDGMISPVSNPFLFEDPRALTEVKPIFMWQQTPSTNYVFRGGDIEYFGLQARVALTQRLDLVLTELGEVASEPHNRIDGFEPHTGFAEVRVGPKYTFYRCEDTGTVAAAGLNFDIPVGSNSVQQNTGSLSLEPYISFGKNFGRTSYGSFNFMNTTGYSVATDNQRSDFVFTSLHLDFDIANAHKIYPLVELNDFYYTAAGKARTLGFEGRDLFNFGSMGTSGENTLSVAAGARYKFNECFQTGIVAEIPIGGHRDLLDFRLTVDFIFRY